MKSFNMFLVAVLSLVVGSFAQPAETFGRYLDVTVNTTSSGGGADVESDVTDFPLLLRLNEDNAAAVLSEALPGGADLRFTDEAKNPLVHEVEYWSDTLAVVWVRASHIEGDANTTIRMHWGKEDADDASDPSAVFNASNGYQAVFHLNEAAGDTAHDATGNYAGIPSGPADPADVPPDAGSHIGGAKAFGGDLDTPLGPGGAYVLRTSGGEGTHDHFAYPGADPRFTMSAWIWLEENPEDCCTDRRRGMITKADHGGSTNGADPVPVSWFMRPNFLQEGTVTRYQFQPSNEISSGAYSISMDSSSTGIWTYLSFSATGPGLENWLRGYNESVTSFLESPANEFAATSVPVVIGGFWSSDSGATDSVSHFINAMLDEVRISTVGRAPEWVDLEFATQRPNVTALSYGAAQDNDTSRIFLYPVQAASLLINSEIDDIAPYVKPGNDVTNYSIDPDLPAGLDFSSSTGVISGTPTATSGSAQYEVTATIEGSPHRDTLTIAVLAGNPPGAPLGVMAEAGPGQALVSWAAPADMGSSAITEYTVLAVEDTGKTCVWTEGPLECAVTGLENGNDYTFTVVASNSVGSGPVSDPSPEVTPATTPDAPTNVTATQLTGGGATASATVSWTAPASDGGLPISGTFAFGDPSGACFAAPPSTSCVVSNLEYSTAYTFRVAASNAMGAGDTSATSEALTPVGLLPGSFSIQASGRPFTFVLSEQGIKSTEAFTVAIHDIWGRKVWSRTVHPARDEIGQLTWDSRNTSGRVVSSGMYLVQVSTVVGGTATNFIQKAVKH